MISNINNKIEKYCTELSNMIDFKVGLIDTDGSKSTGKTKVPEKYYRRYFEKCLDKCTDEIFLKLKLVIDGLRD